EFRGRSDLWRGDAADRGTDHERAQGPCGEGQTSGGMNMLDVSRLESRLYGGFAAGGSSLQGRKSRLKAGLRTRPFGVPFAKQRHFAWSTPGRFKWPFRNACT